MALKTKTIKIGKFDINIIEFSALEGIALRSEVVKKIKELSKDNSSMDKSIIIESIVGLLYEIPGELYMKLFKNCSALDIGELSDKNNFNSVFEGNIDGINELAIEVLNFNGFFSLRFIEILKKKIPGIAPIIDHIMQALEETKKNFSNI